MLSSSKLSTATTQISVDMSVTNQSSNRTLIMNIIFISVLAVLVLVAQPALAGAGSSADSGDSGDSGVENQNAPNALSDLMQEAFRSMRNENYPMAIESLEKEINANPENPDPWVQLGNIVLTVTAEDLVRSSVMGNTVMELYFIANRNVKNSTNTIHKGVFTTLPDEGRAVGNEMTLAKYFYHHALDLDPDNKIVINSLASFYLKQDKVLLEQNIVGRQSLVSALVLANKLSKACKFNCAPIKELITKINAADAARDSKNL